MGLGEWVEALGRHANDGSRLTDNFESFGQPASGSAEPLRAYGNDVARAVSTPGVDLTKMAVRAVATCEGGTFPLLYLLGRWDAAAKTGLMAYVAFPDIVAIGSCTGGSYDGDYDAVSVPALDDDTPHTYEFLIYDSPSPMADFLIDGVSAFGVPVDISGGAGAAVTHGTGGLGGLADSPDIPGISVSEWEVDDDPGAPPDDPCADPAGAVTTVVEEFTGDVADINGRTPDDASATTWCGPITGSTGVLKTVSGKLQAVERETDSYYDLLGVAGPDYRIKVSGVFHSLDGGWVSAMARWLPGLSGYELVLGANGVLQVYKVSGGSYTGLMTAEVGIEIDVPFLLEFDVNGSTLKAYFQTGLVLSGVDSTYPSGGSPGVNLANGPSGTLPTVEVERYEIAASGGPGFPDPTPPTGPQTTVALEHFTGPEDLDVTGRLADGVAFPTAGGVCYQDGEWATITEFSTVPITPIVQLDIPDWRDHIWKGAGYAGVSSYFETETSLLLHAWEDIEPGDLLLAIGYSRNGQMSPQVISGFTEIANQNNFAFTGHLMVCARVVEAGDPSDWTMNFSGTPDLINERFCANILCFKKATVAAVTDITTWLPNQHYVNIDPEGLTADANHVLVAIGGKRARQRLALSGQRPGLNADEGFEICSWSSSSASQTAGPIYAIEDGPGVSIATAWHKGPSASPGVITIQDLGDSSVYPDTEEGGMGLVVRLAIDPLPPNPNDGYLVNRAPRTADTVTFSQQSPIDQVGILHSISALGEEGELPAVEGYSAEIGIRVNDRYAVGPNGIKLYVLMDKDHGLGYHFGYIPLDGTCYLRHWGVGFPVANTMGPVYPAGTPIKLRVCIVGSVPNGVIDFQCYVNDILVIETSHFWDGTTHPLGATPLWPGVEVEQAENYNSGKSCYLDYMRVSLACDSPYPEVCDDCTGDPDGPDPYPNPPPFPTQYGFNIYSGGAFRNIIRIQEWRRGQFRDVYGEVVPEEELNFWGKGKFRPVLFFDGETIPEPNNPHPPYYDPCNLLPPIDPGPVIPLTSRWFGMSNTPPSIMTADFMNGNQEALGNWSNTTFAKMVAIGGSTVCAQGGINQYQPGGVFNVSTFIAAAIARVGLFYAGMAANTASGACFGYSFVDDFESKSIHPPDGISEAEMAAICSALKLAYPGIRIGARARPSQFSSNPGFDFYSAQHNIHSMDSFAFGALEYGLAASRGAYVWLDLNYLHGGTGDSGVRYGNGTIKGQSDHNWLCSAAEIVSAFTGMYAGAQSVDPNVPLLAGSKGYQYHPDYLSGALGVPNVIPAMVTARNALAALPALP